MAEFEKLQKAAEERGERGANLGHVLAKYGGAKFPIRILAQGSRVEYAFASMGNTAIEDAPLYRDSLSDMKYFFAVVPLPFLHHDDRINPRTIGANIRGLTEEFMKKRPQLHVALQPLSRWPPGRSGRPAPGGRNRTGPLPGEPPRAGPPGTRGPSGSGAADRPPAPPPRRRSSHLARSASRRRPGPRGRSRRTAATRRTGCSRRGDRARGHPGRSRTGPGRSACARPTPCSSHRSSSRCWITSRQTSAVRRCTGSRHRRSSFSPLTCLPL